MGIKFYDSNGKYWGEYDETRSLFIPFKKRTMRDCYNCKRYEAEGECIECHFEPKDEPQTDCLEQFRVGLEYHRDTTHFGKAKGESVTTNRTEDEPQTNADQHTQDVGSVGSVEQTEAWKEPFEAMTDCPWK